ncbi:MAG: 30S ribosome-binding factor RbfA [Armatimonadetes bacterium]|nr:30S ribosome-binding factor RbfA [Armatimonadota bacterium]MDE2206578.1 30S ribosome-binding factor RbfA [Armatimonadota bacterium]
MTLRQERIQNALIRDLSEMIHRDLRDPRLVFVTITGAEISRDLRHARVAVTVMGDDAARAAALHALNAVAGRLAGAFTRHSHLRVAPEIRFQLDAGMEHAERMRRILEQVAAELPPLEDESAPGEGAV